MKNYLVDTHMHTIASGHAYNTFDEMMAHAAAKHMDIVCITEHGPAMPGAVHPFYHSNLRIIDNEKHFYPPNVEITDENKNQYTRLIKGFEANIIDYEGNTDYDTLEDAIHDLKYIIASFHSCCLESGTKEQNTNAYIGAIKKPYVVTIGHIDDGRVPCDYEKVVEAAKENNVLVEVNNSSLSKTTFRVNAAENILKYLEICKEQKAMIVLGSDAHYKDDIGNFTNIMPLLEKVNFPEELIINRNADMFFKWVKNKHMNAIRLMDGLQES